MTSVIRRTVMAVLALLVVLGPAQRRHIAGTTLGLVRMWVFRWR
jgi:hypothetical protein